MMTLLAFIVSFLVTFISVPIFRALAFRFKILDIPGGRKVHHVPTPLMGGVAVYLGFIIGVLFNLSKLHFFLPLIVGATFILVFGLLNDISEIRAQLRITYQTLVSLLVIAMGVRVSFLPAGPWWDALEIAITVFWIVGVTNSYNYLDGLDGLAAGSAVINLFCFGAILYNTGQYHLGLLSIILMAACLGFLPYNMNKARIFLGEAGSTLLGFILAGIALLGNWAQDSIVKISIPVLILGVPIFDMIFTTIMRVRENKVKTVLEWLRYSGRDHFHHYLVDVGFKPLGAVVFIYFLSLSLGISAIMVSNDLAAEAFLTMSQAVIIFGIIAALMVIGKRRRSGWR